MQLLQLRAKQQDRRYAFLPRFEPMGVFCNAKPAAEPRGVGTANGVDNAGVLPNRLLLVAVVAPNTPAHHCRFTTDQPAIF